MPLTDTKCRNAKGQIKPRKLSDGGGLHLLINSDGAKYWRLAYRWHGKQRTLAIGVYPAIGLMEARAARDEAKRNLAAAAKRIEASPVLRHIGPTIVFRVKRGMSGADDVVDRALKCELCLPSSAARLGSRLQPSSARLRPRSASSPLDLSASEAHSCGCPFGSPPGICSFSNLSFLGQGRMDNLLKLTTSRQRLLREKALLATGYGIAAGVTSSHSANRSRHQFGRAQKLISHEQ